MGQSLHRAPSKTEVEHWYWEVWNEPNIFYWRRTAEEYHKLYDFSVDAVKRARPRLLGARMWRGRVQRRGEFLREFLDHCVRGTNHAPGKQVGLRSILSRFTPRASLNSATAVRTGIAAQLQDIDRGFAIVASFPELRGKPIIIGESTGTAVQPPPSIYPQNGYRTARCSRVTRRRPLHASISWPTSTE